MRGYKFPKEENKPERKMRHALVGCNRCHFIWYEEVLDIGLAINGPMYCYDYCDKCITEQEKKDVAR